MRRLLASMLAVGCATALWTALGVTVVVTPVAAADVSVDTSEAAVQNFMNWWQHENFVPADADQATDSVLNWGVQACNFKATGINAQDVVNTISTEGGFTIAGAQGIYRSALEALCPQFRGFKTHFDKEIDMFKEALDKKLREWGVQWTTPPAIFDYGWFARAVNDGFGQGYNYVTILPWLRQQPLVLARVTGLSDDQLYEMVQIATTYWKSG